MGIQLMGTTSAMGILKFAAKSVIMAALRGNG